MNFCVLEIELFCIPQKNDAEKKFWNHLRCLIIVICWGFKIWNFISLCHSRISVLIDELCKPFHSVNSSKVPPSSFDRLQQRVNHDLTVDWEFRHVRSSHVESSIHLIVHKLLLITGIERNLRVKHDEENWPERKHVDLSCITCWLVVYFGGQIIGRNRLEIFRCSFRFAGASFDMIDPGDLHIFLRN